MNILKYRKRPFQKASFTLIELLVVVAIIGILVSLLLPSLSKAREIGKRAVCLSNQKQISIATQMYIFQDDHFMPYYLSDGVMAKRWYNYLGFEDKERVCPSVTVNGIGYNHPTLGPWMNYGPNINDIKDPVKTVSFADAGQVLNVGEVDPNKWVATNPTSGSALFRVPNNMPFYSDTNHAQRVIGRHAGTLSSVFVDGHGETMKASGLGMQYPKFHASAYWDSE